MKIGSPDITKTRKYANRRNGQISVPWGNNQQ